MNVSRYFKHYLLNVLISDCIQQTSYRNSNICLVDNNLFRIENRYNKREIIFFAIFLTWNVLRSEIYTLLSLRYYLKLNGQAKILSNKHSFNNLFVVICQDLLSGIANTLPLYISHREVILDILDLKDICSTRWEVSPLL